RYTTMYALMLTVIFVFFFKQKTAYEFFTLLEFRRVLFRSPPQRRQKPGARGREGAGADQRAPAGHGLGGRAVLPVVAGPGRGENEAGRHPVRLHRGRPAHPAG